MVALSVVVPCYNEEASLPRWSPSSGEVLPGVARDVRGHPRRRRQPRPHPRDAARGQRRGPAVPLPRPEPQLRQGVGDARRPEPGPRRRRGDHGRRPPAPARSCSRRWSRCSTRATTRWSPAVPATGDPVVRTVLSRALLPDDQPADRRRARGRRRRLPGARAATRSARCCAWASTTGSPRASSPGSASPPRSSTTRTSRARPARPSGGCATCSTTASTASSPSTTGRCGWPSASALFVTAVAFGYAAVGAVGRGRCTATACPATSPSSAPWSASAASS